MQRTLIDASLMFVRLELGFFFMQNPTIILDGTIFEAFLVYIPSSFTTGKSHSYLIGIQMLILQIASPCP